MGELDSCPAAGVVAAPVRSTVVQPAASWYTVYCSHSWPPAPQRACTASPG